MTNVFDSFRSMSARISSPRSSSHSNPRCRSQLFKFIIKFPYNARSDWLKQRALSEIRERVDDIKGARSRYFR